MTPLSATTSALAGLPQPPLALTRALIECDGFASARSTVKALAGDPEVARLFLRLAKRALPGRRVLGAGQAVALLGDGLAMRLALLASGTVWLKWILGDDPLAPALLRHSVAAAVAAEPLGRDSGLVDPLHAFALGLFHHLGDAARIAVKRVRCLSIEDHERWQVAAEMLRSAGAPDVVTAAILDYGRFMRVPSHSLPLEGRLLAAADHAVTAFGYATPSPCAQPAVNAPILDTVASLFEAKRRVVRAIEDVLGTAVEPETMVPEPAESSQPCSMVVRNDAHEGVSARDLGPLPVLFSRIADASDADAVAVASTAGLVEELGASRAYYLTNQGDSMLKGGVLCSRGNVPLPLHELMLAREDLPRALMMAVATGRPILHEELEGGLEELATDEALPTYFVPVVAGKEVLGVLGVEVSDPDLISADLLSAIALHTGLALKTLDLRKLSDEAKTDELTGLYNRRGILDLLDRQLADMRPDQGFAIALIDCDHLKKVNDNFGHLMGDEFVRRISEVLKLSLRTSDELGRYGGDEFLAVLPDVGLEHTRLAMERARVAVEQAGLDSQDGLLLSVSIGAVVRGRSGASREKLLKLADYALYRAKERGRNAVDVIHAEQPPEHSL